MDKFEVGKTYDWADPCFDPITVLKRTDKTITVTNGTNTWRMLLRHDSDGSEYVCDSTMGKGHHIQFTSRPTWLTH